MPLSLDLRVGETVTIASDKPMTVAITLKDKSGQRAKLSLDTGSVAAIISHTRPVHLAAKGLSKELHKEA